TLSSENGSISTDPDGSSFEEGTEVELTAEADFAYEFSHWSGDVSGSDNPVTITMDSDKNVTANFEEATTYALDITDENGVVEIDPDREAFLENEEVTLTAYQDSGFVFMGWSGDAEGTDNPLTLTMSEDKSVTAMFEPRDEYALYDQGEISIASVSSEDEYGDGRPAANAINGDKNAVWFTHWEDPAETHPHEIVLKLNESRVVGGLQYTPRQDSENGRIHEYDLYLSTDGESWGDPAVSGLWRNSEDLQEAVLSEADTAQFIRLVAKSEVNGEVWASVANLDVLYVGGVSAITDGKNTAEVMVRGSLLTMNKNEPLRVRISSLKGQNLTTIDTDGTQTVNLNSLGISPGMYILQVQNASGESFLTQRIHMR
ncbi:MAG: InlB B-repeat-containing protein, partial [Fibrobacterota bacterium]